MDRWLSYCFWIQPHVSHSLFSFTRNTSDSSNNTTAASQALVTVSFFSDFVVFAPILLQSALRLNFWEIFFFSFSAFKRLNFLLTDGGRGACACLWACLCARRGESVFVFTLCGFLGWDVCLGAWLPQPKHLVMCLVCAHVGTGQEICWQKKTKKQKMFGEASKTWKMNLATEYFLD